MKIIRCSFLIFIIVLTACAPQRTITQLPVPVITKTPFPSATPVSTQTPAPTATPVIPVEITLDPCYRIAEAKVSKSGILEIVLEDVVLSLWSEETHRVVPIPLPPDALNPIISPDNRWVLFRRDISSTQSEFSVIGTDGKDEKKLGAVSLDEELKARYPDWMFSLDYGWIPNSDTFFYEVDVTYGVIPPLIIDKLVLVDAITGQAIQLENSTEINAFHFSPDGTQMAIGTEDEFYVLSTQDGKKQFTVETGLSFVMYSPDGRYIVDFVDEGILRLNARTGQQLVIPLKYTTLRINEPEGFERPREFAWRNDSTLLFISLNSDQRVVSLLPYMIDPDPEWTFTVWQVDLEDGTAHPIQIFSGDPSTAKFSPDTKLLAFQKFEVSGESKRRDMYLVDLASGEILEAIAGGLFHEWLPDSGKYLYSTGVPYPPPEKGAPDAGTSDSTITHYLGKVGGKSILMNWNNIPWYDWWWVDENRLVTDCKIVTFP